MKEIPWALAVLTLTLPGAVLGDSIRPEKAQVSAAEGKPVTLRCSYSTTISSNVYLWWYRQYPSKSPEYILARGARGSTFTNTAAFAKERFSSTATYDSTSLSIRKLSLSDTATYHCALVMDWGGATTDKLIFGKGTKLTVEAGNQDYREPSVFLLKNESTYACVANNFYPKNAKIHMKLPGKKTITNIEHKAVTSDGKYSMVQITEFESDGAVNCTVEHEGKYVTPQQDKEKTDDSKTKTDKESTSKNSMSDSGKDDAQSNQQEAGPICREIKVRSEVVNTLSVTVLGLRVIFAKSVTLNLLLTAKYFFF